MVQRAGARRQDMRDYVLSSSDMALRPKVVYTLLCVGYLARAVHGQTVCDPPNLVANLREWPAGGQHLVDAALRGVTSVDDVRTK